MRPFDLRNKVAIIAALWDNPELMGQIGRRTGRLGEVMGSI